MTPLELAKVRFTVPELWGMLGLPGTPPRTGSAGHSPFRQDRRPSFSIFDEGRAFKDHATGDAGDIVDFLALARGCDTGAAARELISMAGSPRPVPAPLARSIDPARVSAYPVPKKPEHAGPAFPKDMRAPTMDELAEIATIRRFPGTIGLERAAAGGFLHVGMLPDLREGSTEDWHRVRAWIVTDSTRRNAQARRMDGEPWCCLGMAKARTLRGSAASWPIGAAEIGDNARVLIAEGGPDFLALHHLVAATGVADCAPVAMLGASQDIPPEAAEYIAGKDCLLFPHTDDAGARARDEWAGQLYDAGAKSVRFVDLAPLFAGHDGKDLNDLLTIGAHPEAPAGLCPKCWDSGIVASMGGPTCAHCEPYVWPEAPAVAA